MDLKGRAIIKLGECRDIACNRVPVAQRPKLVLSHLGLAVIVERIVHAYNGGKSTRVWVLLVSSVAEAAGASSERFITGCDK